eukprot:snap_masked-scaffold_83-processed-gene-0.34-mRNA-1 protein AED:1.00 eAED:1.00 QI:0/-1/0/0/-1/1/1/0/331
MKQIFYPLILWLLNLSKASTLSRNLCAGFVSTPKKHSFQISSNTPWQTIFDTSLLPYVDNVQKFKSAMQPILDVNTVTYVNNENEVNITDFELVGALRPEDGVNAVAYKYTGTQASSKFTYLMFAFRGTISFADNCANEIIFAFGNPRSEACIEAFSVEDLDYVSQADNFISTTISSLNLRRSDRVKVLLSGHSMGSSIANYMNAFYQERSNLKKFKPKVRFASFSIAGVGIKSIIESENSDFNETGCALMLFNQHDPVPKIFEINQAGLQCTFPDEEVPEPESCAECYAADPVTYEGCTQCRYDTHSIRVYRSFISTNTTSIPSCKYVGL